MSKPKSRRVHLSSVGGPIVEHTDNGVRLKFEPIEHPEKRVTVELWWFQVRDLIAGIRKAGEDKQASLAQTADMIRRLTA